MELTTEKHQKMDVMTERHKCEEQGVEQLPQQLPPTSNAQRDTDTQQGNEKVSQQDYHLPATDSLGRSRMAVV